MNSFVGFNLKPGHGESVHVFDADDSTANARARLVMGDDGVAAMEVLLKKSDRVAVIVKHLGAEEKIVGIRVVKRSAKARK